MDDDTKARRRALAAHLEEKKADIEPLDYAPYGEGVGFETPGAEWAVLTDAEADTAWDASLESYIDECLLPEYPDDHPLVRYFDHEAWKRDARMDGRGHSLSGYDGNEEDIEDPKTGARFVAYRTN